MLEFEFIRLIPEYIRQYRAFPIPVIICDRAFASCWSNDAAKKLYPSATDINGLACLLAEYDGDALFRELEERGSCTITDVIPFGGADVSMLPVLSDGETVGAVLLFLTLDTRPSPGRVYHSSRTAKSLNTSIREYVSSIFSEMDATSAKAELLHSGWIKSSFNRIGVGGYRILRVTENISEYSKFQCGAPELSLQTVNLADLLLEASGAIGEFGQSMGIPVSFDLSDAPCAVSADRARLELALFNLIHNSMYFSRPGNRIDIALSRSSDYVTLLIGDRGVGIEEELLPNIWKPYTSYSLSDNCLGLGLTIVSLVAEAHRADVELLSEKDKGTTVTLRFPIAPLSVPISFGRDDSRIAVRDRFSRLYTGLADAAESPYHE